MQNGTRDTTEFAKYHESYFLADHVFCYHPKGSSSEIGTRNTSYRASNWHQVPSDTSRRGLIPACRVCAPLQWAKLRMIWHLVPAGCSSPPSTRIATSARIRTLQSYRHKSISARRLSRAIPSSRQIKNFRMSTRISQHLLRRVSINSPSLFTVADACHIKLV